MNPLAAASIVLVGFLCLGMILIPLLEAEIARAVARRPANDNATQADVEEEARHVG